MRKSRVNLAAVKAAFERRAGHVFSHSNLVSAFYSSEPDWNLPHSMNRESFVEMLLRQTKMEKVILESKEYAPLSRYTWGSNVAPVLVALSIKPKAFCSHGSAMWVHGLGGDEHHIFVNIEQSEKTPKRNALSQEAIDRAFHNEQRRSKLVYAYRGAHITVLSGKNSGRLEVVRTRCPSGEDVEVTSLERTLVDIIVRPAYAGGLPHVLESFRRARRKASVGKLLRILETLDYSYPYHQSLGFLMRRSGYPESDLNRVKKLGTPFNFYLGHGMKGLGFDEEFKVFFPRSLK